MSKQPEIVREDEPIDLHQLLRAKAKADETTKEVRHDGEENLLIRSNTLEIYWSIKDVLWALGFESGEAMPIVMGGRTLLIQPEVYDLIMRGALELDSMRNEVASIKRTK